VPVNLFPNASEEELVALAETLQRRLTVGEVQFVTLPGGGQMNRTWQNTRDAQVMLMRVLYSLHLISPGSYDNPYVGRVRRTMPSYA
jgi:hypothetical protein